MTDLEKRLFKMLKKLVHGATMPAMDYSELLVEAWALLNEIEPQEGPPG